MTLVELDIGKGSFVARLPSRGVSVTIRDEVVIRNRKIEGIGDDGLDLRQRVGPGIVTQAAFDPADFDPNVAVSIVVYAAARAIGGPNLGWRAALTRPAIEIRWPDWRQIAPGDRRVFVESIAVRVSRLDINGTPAVWPRVDFPILRWFAGSRVRTDAG